MVPSKEMVTAIKEILNEKKLGIRKLVQFGSSLDPDRFDRRGEGTSDFDLLAVVQATMPLEKNTQLNEFRISSVSAAHRHFIYRHEPCNSYAPWSQNREIHLLIAPAWWASDIEKIIAERPTAFDDSGDVFAKALLKGKKLFPEET